jgi:predicted enzyme related to lactoylglutathione lyase
MSATEFAITLDCANAAELAAFWSEVLGRPVDPSATGEFAAIGLAEGSNGRPVWMFHQVPETKTAKNRAHVDLVTADLAAEVDRVVRLGASRIADLEEAGARWTTLTDPAGNEFDLVAQPAG